MNPRDARHRITADLLASDVAPGGVLLVHSSLSSMGHVPGGPETVVLALLDALGPRGTLLMPALSFATVGPQPGLTGSENREPYVFDVRSTPSCVGAIPEHFRRRAGTLRSVHPTHSVCGVGPRADEMLRDHHLDTTPVGPHSAFRRLPEVGGQVLMLGCGLGPMTSMHGVEEIAEPADGPPPPFLGPPLRYRLIHADGHATEIRYRRHHFPGLRQRYDRLAPLLAGDGMTVGKVLRAVVHVLDAPTLWRVGLETIRRDPMHFIARI